MYDHERSLVERYKNKPFKLIGVSADDPDSLPDIMKRNNINWDSWADGLGGPIAAAWKVHSYPTVFIIDKNGIIRAKGHGEGIDEMIERLLRE
jgi:peroxiredoxin